MSKFFDQLENLSKKERDHVLSGLLASQSLIRSIEQDGFSIPDEIAAAIALFDRTEYDTLAKALFDLIFRGIPICTNNGDSAPWCWISNQEKPVVKSLFCWLVRRSEKAILRLDNVDRGTHKENFTEIIAKESHLI